MLDALAQSGAWLAAESPDAVVALSARWLSDGPFLVDIGKRHRTLTDYSGFGVEVRYDCAGLPALARALVDEGTRLDIRVGATQRGVDSGITVPLHFLLPRSPVPVVPLSLALRSLAECRKWGAVLARVLTARPERIVFVVGGLLSHDQHAWNLKREVPEARQFDEQALQALQAGAWDALRTVDARVRERAQPEAEMRHLEVLRGFLGSDLPGVVRCYEPGPGIGAALVEFELPVRDAATTPRD